MRTRAATTLLGLVSIAGCSTPGGPYPSLAPRAGEAVDPRVPVTRPAPSLAVSDTVASRVASLLADALNGDALFGNAAATAENLAAMAGPAHSESWVTAQQALSAAQAAREQTVRALGDIDELAATALATKGGIAAGDLAAIQSASERVAALDRGQIARLREIQARLGR